MLSFFNCFHALDFLIVPVLCTMTKLNLINSNQKIIKEIMVERKLQLLSL